MEQIFWATLYMQLSWIQYAQYSVQTSWNIFCYAAQFSW